MLFTVLLILKIILFMFLTGVKYSKALILGTSVLYTLFFFSLIYLSRNKKKQTLAFALYITLSSLMFVDSVYYYYFNGLPSIAMFKMLGVVQDVSDSVKYIIHPIHLIFLLDIPVLCFYSGRKKKRLRAEGKVYDDKKRIGVPSVFALTLLVVFVFAHNTGYITAVNKQEIYTYHFRDLIGLFTNGGEAAEGEEVGKHVPTKGEIQEIKERSQSKEGKYTGIGKGKNLLVIQVESLQNFPINRYYENQELTPNLNKLIQEKGSLHFSRYYQLLGRGNTSDAEFVTQNSLYPSMDDQTYTIYADNTYYGLPWILKDNGYTPWVFHGYKKEFWNRANAYPNQGFERFISEEDYKVGDTIGLGINDEDFFDQSISYIKGMQKPYYAFAISLSSHNPFNLPKKYQGIKLKEEHKDTLFGNYLQAVHYADKALGQFIDDLKKEGLYDDTVICIYGDHFGLKTPDKENDKLMSDFLGYPYDFDEMMRIPLIIHVPGADVNEEITKVGSQLDFLPTILNIMGMKNEKGIMFGRDIINSGSSFVAQQTYMLKGSFIDGEKVFVMSRDGIYDHSRAYNIETRHPVNLNDCKKGYEKAIKEINISDYILKNNLAKKRQ